MAGHFGLVCVSYVGGSLCPCESHPGVPSSQPYMNDHGEAACQCHADQAERYGVEPFPCERGK